MSRFNLAPSLACSSGPTTGCHEQGQVYRVMHDGQRVESRVLCLYHAPLVLQWSGSGYSLEASRG